jgi:hypothetical protein
MDVAWLTILFFASYNLLKIKWGLILYCLHLALENQEVRLYYQRVSLDIPLKLQFSIQIYTRKIPLEVKKTVIAIKCKHAIIYLKFR